MSSVAPPSDSAGERGAPSAARTLSVPPFAGSAARRPATAPARPDGRQRFVGPAVLTGTAGLVVAASLAAASGGRVGGSAVIEILVVLIGGGLTVAAIATGRANGVPGGWALAGFGALAVFTALSVLWAVEPDGAWSEANRTLAYLATFAGAASLARLARGREAWFLGGMLLGLSAACAAALASKVAPEWLNEAERFARLREPFGYWNAVGLTGALAVPLALWLATRRDGRPAVDALAYPAITLALTAILLAYSRGSLLAAAIGTALWFALTDRRVRGAAALIIGASGAAFVTAWTFGQDALTQDGAPLGERGAAGLELLVLLAAVLLLVLITGLALGFIADLRPLSAGQRRRLGIALVCVVGLAPVAGAATLATTDAGIGGSISTAWTKLTDPSAAPPSNDPGRLTETGSIRARYWDDAFRMLGERELVGHGAGGYATVRPRYRRDTIDVRHAHGYVPQTLADLGFVGLGISLLALVAFALTARLAIARTRGPQRTALITLAAVATVFGVHSTIDWTWFTVGTAIAAMLAAGWLAGVGAAARPPGADPALSAVDRRVRLALAGVVALLAFALAWSAWQPLRAERAADRAIALAEERRFDEAREAARSAADHNPLSAEPLLALATVERSTGDDRGALRALQEAVRLEPSSYGAWLRLADHQLFALNDPKAALESVRAAVYLNPTSFTVTQRYLDVTRTLRNRSER